MSDLMQSGAMQLYYYVVNLQKDKIWNCAWCYSYSLMPTHELYWFIFLREAAFPYYNLELDCGQNCVAALKIEPVKGPLQLCSL